VTQFNSLYNKIKLKSLFNFSLIFFILFYFILFYGFIKVIDIFFFFLSYLMSFTSHLSVFYIMDTTMTFFLPSIPKN